MIVLDSSAILAVLLGEADAASFEARLVAEDRCLMSAVNVLEMLVVLRCRRGSQAVASARQLLTDLAVEIVPFDDAQAEVAVAAFERFGKGLHAQARLNICDCAAYALAKARALPLLYKGNDFPHTDIVSAM